MPNRPVRNSKKKRALESTEPEPVNNELTRKIKKMKRDLAHYKNELKILEKQVDTEEEALENYSDSLADREKDRDEKLSSAKREENVCSINANNLLRKKEAGWAKACAEQVKHEALNSECIRENEMDEQEEEIRGLKSVNAKWTYEVSTGALVVLPCFKCKENFDDTVKKTPLSMICGHTFCRSCLLETRYKKHNTEYIKCFICKNPRILKDCWKNYQLIN